MEGDPSSARRKRIMERGSDRLAFITGEAKSLPIPCSPPPPRTPSNIEVASFTPAEVIVENDDESGQSPECEVSPRDESAEEEFPKCKLGKEFPKRGKSNETATGEAIIDPQTAIGGMEVSNASTVHGSSNQVVGAAPFTATLMNPQLFTPSAISRSISATEGTRLLCAISIAILVVLSSHGYSLGGRILSSLVSFRPLFLVLLTDITIVLGLVLSTEGSDRNEGTTRTGQEEKGLADNVGNALEAGLLVQKASRAVFMDCSICAVIMICGLANVYPS